MVVKVKENHKKDKRSPYIQNLGRFHKGEQMPFRKKSVSLTEHDMLYRYISF